MSTHKLTTHSTAPSIESAPHLEPVYITMIVVPPTERLPPVPCPQLRSPRPDGVNSPKFQTCVHWASKSYLIQIGSSLLHRLIKMTWAPNKDTYNCSNQVFENFQDRRWNIGGLDNTLGRRGPLARCSPRKSTVKGKHLFKLDFFSFFDGNENGSTSGQNWYQTAPYVAL